MSNPIPKENEDKYPPFQYAITATERLRNTNSPESPLVKLIEARQSSRQFKLLDRNTLSNVLWYSAKTREALIQNNGYIITSRPAPSAGGRHPIDIIVSQPNSTDNQHETFSYYNPFEHSLNTLNLDSKKCHALLKHIDNILPIQNATIIWFVAHSLRTASKYKNHQSLVWRDAGALIYCFQVACTAFNTRSCAVGSLGEPFISDLFNSQDGVFGVGGLLIGK